MPSLVSLSMFYTGQLGQYMLTNIPNKNHIVVNKQTESHKGSIFYLQEVELLYNDVHHSQPTL